LSVAALAKAGSTDVLLGADLEEHGSPTRGWSAVIASPNRPSGAAVLFKVAHHGSVTGHHDDIWTTLLVPGAAAVVTPWNRGRKLPTDVDCARIRGLTNQGYLTSRIVASPIRSIKLSAVARTVRESKIKIRSLHATTGFVQFRRRFGATGTNWNVRLSSEAVSLVS
jgi:hypothetical protein